MKNHARQQYGFTLLEIMLVILLMGVVVTGVVITVSSAGADSHLEKEAKRFVGILELAEEEALLRSQEMGVIITDRQYQFVRLDDDNRWQPLSDSKFFSQVTMPDEITLSLELAGLTSDNSLLGDQKLFENDDGLFEDNGGLFEDKDEKQQRKLTPELYIFSSGEVTDFELTMNYYDGDLGDRQITIKFDKFGALVITPVTDAN